ncbi:MAG: hypothetical protein E7211_19055 [Clostridium lundense]|nr:hypothetical protein [Clostridium lundense]
MVKNSEFQFKNPNLKRLEFRVNEDFDVDLYDGLAIDASTIVRRLADGLSAIVELNIVIGAKDETNPFWIDVSMESLFKWQEGIDEAMREKLISSNAPTLLLSYIRPIISQITSTSRYPRFDLPFLDMTKNDVIER